MHAQVCMCARISVLRCVRVCCACVHARARVCVCMSVCAWVCVCECVCECVRDYVCMCVYVYKYMCISVIVSGCGGSVDGGGGNVHGMLRSMKLIV